VSRGPGRWQRLLLDHLAEYDLVPVRVVVNNAVWPDALSRADMVSARRAAHKLVATGRAKAEYLLRCDDCDDLWNYIIPTVSIIPGEPPPTHGAEAPCPACRGRRRRVLVLVSAASVQAESQAALSHEHATGLREVESS
jgi:hypothetical protein